MIYNIKEKIDALKLEIKQLYEENVQLKSQIESLNVTNTKLSQMNVSIRETFNSELEVIRRVTNDMLGKMKVDTKALIDATLANETMVLVNNALTLEVLKDLQTQYDKLKTEYNNYIKANT